MNSEPTQSPIVEDDSHEADAVVARIRVGKWVGRFLRSGEPAEWSTASRLTISDDDWQREWPRLLQLLRNDQLDVLKRDASGEVLAATVTLAGRSVDVIVKRPRNKYLYRYAFDLFRWSRGWRTWANTMKLLSLGVPIERPLLLLEWRVGLYAFEAVGVYERVPGTTLETFDLDTLTAEARERMFLQCGESLRTIEASALEHPDAKSSNWIISPGLSSGTESSVTPVIIDAYGVTRLTRGNETAGLHRLLRAMKLHPQYTPVDSLHICQGYAPESGDRIGPEAGDDD